MTTACHAPSGKQFELHLGDQRIAVTEVGAALEHIAEVCSVDDSFLGASPRQIEALSIANRVLARLRRSAPEGPDHE